MKPPIKKTGFCTLIVLCTDTIKDKLEIIRGQYLVRLCWLGGTHSANESEEGEGEGQHLSGERLACSSTLAWL